MMRSLDYQVLHNTEHVNASRRRTLAYIWKLQILHCYFLHLIVKNITILDDKPFIIYAILFLLSFFLSFLLKLASQSASASSLINDR